MCKVLPPCLCPSLQTTLHLAVHTQQTEMVCQLLRAGASLHLTDHKGNSPLHIASRSSTKCLDEIFNATANSTILDVSQIRNNQGLTCVHLAVLAGNTEALLRLKRAGVDMNMQVGRLAHLCGVLVIWYFPGEF